MKLTHKQLNNYLNKGFLVVKDVFNTQELEVILKILDNSIADYKNNSKSSEGLVTEQRESLLDHHLKLDVVGQKLKRRYSFE